MKVSFSRDVALQPQLHPTWLEPVHLGQVQGMPLSSESRQRPFKVPEVRMNPDALRDQKDSNYCTFMLVRCRERCFKGIQYIARHNSWNIGPTLTVPKTVQQCTNWWYLSGWCGAWTGFKPNYLFGWEFLVSSIWIEKMSLTEHPSPRST